LGRGLPRSHATFLDFIESLANRGYTLHFHTLNHDLFFESLSSTDAIQGALSDGFAELGSPYYGTFQNVIFREDGNTDSFSYTVRLSYYTGKFDSQFNLYKLHGSVNYYVFNDEDRATVKTKRGIGPNDLLKEVKTDRMLKYESDFGNYYPNFLSGTTYKTLRYDSTPYYDEVFRRFRENLETTSILIVIGYGFADSEINRLLETHFLNSNHSIIIDIDVKQPNMPQAIAKSSQYFPGGVKECDFNALLQAITPHPPSAALLPFPPSP